MGISSLIHVTGSCIRASLGQKFVAGKMEEREFKYVGFDIMQNPDGVILGQGQYLQKLESIVIKPDRAKQKRTFR